MMKTRCEKANWEAPAIVQVTDRGRDEDDSRTERREGSEKYL